MRIGKIAQYTIIVMTIIAITVGSLAATAERGGKPRKDPGCYYRVAWEGHNHTAWMSLQSAQNTLAVMWNRDKDIRHFHGETKQGFWFIQLHKTGFREKK